MFNLFQAPKAHQTAVAATPMVPQAPPRTRGIHYGPDHVGMVGFHDQGFVIARPAMPHSPWLIERSQKLHERIAGYTNMTDGLRKTMEVFCHVPEGALRRVWLLSDGKPNQEADSLWPMVEAARQAHININTIGFGDSYDEALLRRISESTHHGRFVPVRTLRELTQALVSAAPGGDGRRGGRHRSETTVLTIDLSGSMNEPMEGKTKVAVVEEAILRLLHYKQRCFA